ncbi:MAG: conjugal transfer protein TraO [Cyclobacteriaceae bacterium]
MKYVFVVVLFIEVALLPIRVIAQRHVKGVSYLEMQAGFVDQWRGSHHQGALLYSKIIDRRWHWQAGMVGAIRDTPPQPVSLRVEKYYGQGTAFYTLGSLFRHSLCFNAGVGPLLGVERIVKPPEGIPLTYTIHDPASKLVIGIQGSVNTELFISSSVIITLNYQQRYANSKIDRLDGVMALGAKFYLH